MDKDLSKTEIDAFQREARECDVNWYHPLQAQDTPQGYYWTNTQCTIHLIVIAYYTCPQPQSPKVIPSCFSLIISNMTNMQCSTSQRQLPTCSKMGSKLKKVIQFSNGSPTQYKSKINFTDCSYVVFQILVFLPKNSTSAHGFGRVHVTMRLEVYKNW